MSNDKKQKRIFHIAKELNISHIEIIKFLESKSINVKSLMDAVSGETYDLILSEFSKEKKSVDRLRKEKARQAVVSNIAKKEPIKQKEDLTDSVKKILKNENAEVKLTITKKADSIDEKTKLTPKAKPKVEKAPLKEDSKKISDITGSEKPKQRKFKKIDLSTIADKISEGKSKSKREKIPITQSVNKFSKKVNKKKTKKKDSIEVNASTSSDSKTIKLPEFTMVDELARSMDVAVQEVIKVCMDLGLMVTINQRLDFDTMLMVADEFDYSIESIEEQDIEIESSLSDDEENDSMSPRPPVVTVMGHVDH